MHDEIISSNDIHLQDVVCSVVAMSPFADDFSIYNRIATMVDIPELETTEKILNLIRINRVILTT